MPPRRQIRNFNNPIDPFAGGPKAGNHDPRNFISGNVPGQQWDIEQQAVDRQSLARAQPDQYASRVHNSGSLSPDAAVVTIPQRVNMVAWQKQGSLTLANTPLMLVPQNTRRLGIFLAPIGVDDVFYSWGKPALSSTLVPIGHRLLPGNQLDIMDSTVPINELWVWSVVGETFLAYEAIDAPEANNQ